jgi:hypothetical protein
VLGQAARGQLLALPAGPYQQGDEHPDAATVHVLEAGEVEQHPGRAAAARLLIGGHQHRLAGRGDLALDVHDRHRTAHLPDVHAYC